ncbi:MAG: isoprenylcysteine carboxylmethyltransferase family protein [Patescibacteria group bacterium]
MKIRPPIIALFYLLAALGVNYLSSATKIISSPYNLIGVILIGAGIFLLLWAAWQFSKKNTTRNPFGVPVVLITTGPFLFTRNPMYLGMTLNLLGIAFLVGTIPFLFTPLAFILTIQSFFIPLEEKKLEKIFGKEYLGYKDRVRRWL